MRRTGDKQYLNQIVVPTKYRSLLLHLVHEGPLAAHIGINKAKELLLGQFYWPNVFNDVKEFVMSCPACQLVGKKTRKVKAPLIITPTSLKPFESTTLTRM